MESDDEVIKITEKKTELALSRIIDLLIKDLNSIEEKNFVTASNMENVAQAFNALAKAEYHILHAVNWINGVNPKKSNYIQAKDIFDEIKKVIKKVK